MPENRIDPLTVANAETNARTAPVSPTGTPAIPTAIAPYAAAVVAVAGALLALFPAGGIPFVVCTVIVAIGAAFGILSSGARK